MGRGLTQMTRIKKQKPDYLATEDTESTEI